jgi:hypothetical protein
MKYDSKTVVCSRTVILIYRRLLVFLDHDFDILAFHFIEITSPPTESGIVKFIVNMDEGNINLNPKCNSFTF